MDRAALLGALIIVRVSRTSSRFYFGTNLRRQNGIFKVRWCPTDIARDKQMTVEARFFAPRESTARRHDEGISPSTGIALKSVL
jgi:hypothetical protein